MGQILLKRFLVSLILVQILLFYAAATTPDTVILIEPKRHPTNTPWPACATVPTYRIRCDPLKDPFVTTTTWHSRTPQPEK